MKINIELEVGAETGIVCAALESQIKMLEEAAKLGGSTLLLQISRRIHDDIETKVNTVLMP